MKNNQRSEAGFTIIELMVAMTVLSVLLIMSTVILMQIGGLYNKGVNTAKVQDAARTVAAEITSALQFSPQGPNICTGSSGFDGNNTCAAMRVPGTLTTPDRYAFCIGTIRYSYVMNRIQGTDSNPDLPVPVTTAHVLWRDTMASVNSTCKPLDILNDTVMADDSSAEWDAGNPQKSRGYEMAPAHTQLTRFYVKAPAAGSNAYSIDVWMAYGDSDLVRIASNGKPSCSGGTGTQFCASAVISSTITGRVY